MLTKTLVRGIGLTLAAGALSAAPLAATAPAQAKICAIDYVSYKAPSKGVKVWVPTKLYSAWQKGGGTVTRSASQGSETAKTKGSSDQVGGEAGANFGFGQASATYNHTWDRSTTRSSSFSSSWSYTVNLPKEKARARLYKQGFKFPITQYTHYTNGCGTKVTKWSVAAPIKKDNTSTYLWAAETYKKRGQLKY